MERFAKSGARVVLCDLGTSKGQDVSKELGSNVVFVPVDVRFERLEASGEDFVL